MEQLFGLDFFSKSYKVALKAILIVALILLFIDYRYCIGFIFGNVCFLINLILKNKYYDFILVTKDFNKGLFVLYYVLSLMLMIASFVVGYLWPNVMNMYAGFLGYLFYRFVLFITAFVGGGKSDH